MENPPAGFLVANGAAVSRLVYARLFAKIGTTFGAGDGTTTFNLPDLRGMFIRGWAPGGFATDPGRVLGSYQADDNKNHTHTGSTNTAGAHTHANGSYDQLLTVDGSWTAKNMDSTPGEPKLIDSRPMVAAGAHSHTMNLDSQGTEARPKNIALLVCIMF
jgi:microcystin-dependent protein